MEAKLIFEALFVARGQWPRMIKGPFQMDFDIIRSSVAVIIEVISAVNQGIIEKWVSILRKV